MGLQLGVKLLCGAETVGSFQDGGEGALLPGRALLGRATGLTVRVVGENHWVYPSSVLVPVAFVEGVAVPVSDVADVLAVRRSHGRSSWECRMASWTM